MEAAIFGLVGVLLGAFLTVAKEWWFQRRRDRKDAEYLAIQVSCSLERYVGGCAGVVGDDGLSEGQPDRDGFSRARVSVPKFEPELLNVEWKCLPSNLMYEVLDFPNKAEAARQSVAAVLEYSATPPDFAEWFEERQYHYATLGIDASRLAAKLREHVGIPAPSERDWDPVDYMERDRSSIDERRKVRDNRPDPL